MANNQERHYNILKLNRLFAISTLVFTAVWLIVFVDDYQRPWKKYQKEFRLLEIEKVRKDLLEASTTLENNSDYNQLSEQLLSSEKKLTNRKDELEKIIKELKKLDSELYKNNQLYQFAKADLDVLKYEYEKSQLGHGSITELEKKYLSLTDNLIAYFLPEANL